LPKVAKNKWKLKVGNPNEKLQQWPSHAYRIEIEMEMKTSIRNGNGYGN